MSNEILSFLEEAIRLKRMVRSGWLYSGVSKADVESVADHSFFVSLLSLVLALNQKTKDNKIDLEKVLIMAILHDISESISQDVDRRIRKFSPEKYDEFKKDLDKNAINHLINLLPDESTTQLRPIMDEFLSGKSNEARLVKEADRLETIIQLNEYIKRGYSKDNFTEFFANFKQEIDSFEFEEIREIAKNLLEK